MPRAEMLQCVSALLLVLLVSRVSTLCEWTQHRYVQYRMLYRTLFVSDCPSQRYLTDQFTRSDFPPLVSKVVVESYLLQYLFAFSSPFDSYCWCSATNILPQNITIFFTEPLVIHGMLRGGYGSGSYREYVTAFSLEYSETNNSGFIVGDLPKVMHTSYVYTYIRMSEIKLLCTGIQCNRL